MFPLIIANFIVVSHYVLDKDKKKKDKLLFREVFSFLGVAETSHTENKDKTAKGANTYNKVAAFAQSYNRVITVQGHESHHVRSQV